MKHPLRCGKEIICIGLNRVRSLYANTGNYGGQSCQNFFFPLDKSRSLERLGRKEDRASFARRNLPVPGWDPPPPPHCRRRVNCSWRRKSVKHIYPCFFPERGEKRHFIVSNDPRSVIIKPPLCWGAKCESISKAIKSCSTRQMCSHRV